MKPIRLLPALLYLLTLIGCLALYFSLEPELQGRIATHFGATGKANGWMEASAFKSFFLGMMLGLPLLLPVIVSALRFLSPKWLNIPNKTYWPTARDFLFFSSFWVATIQTLFFTGLFVLTIEANRLTPPALSNRVWIFTALFLLALGAWIARVIFFFMRKPA